MTELTFLIFATVGLIATAKIWKPFLVAKSEDLEIIIADKKVDQQDELHTLAERIKETKAKHNGDWHSMDSIMKLMK